MYFLELNKQIKKMIKQPLSWLNTERNWESNFNLSDINAIVMIDRQKLYT